MQIKKLLITNGFVVTENTETICDILCEGEKIVKIEKNIKHSGADEIIDAAGKIVIPGGVDVHTHLSIDTGTAVSCDDFFSGTVAAACGGTTSIIDHPGFGPAGCELDHQIDVYHLIADGMAVIDYGFHGVIQHVDENVFAMMETLAEQGITSFKLYLTYDFKLSDADVFKILRRAKELGVIIAAHPENDGMINIMRNEYIAAGKFTAENHNLMRPAVCEAEAVNRMLLFAHAAGDAPLYIVHLSCALGLEFVNAARLRNQKNFWVETCPQYLFLDEGLYSRPDNESLKYIICPPLRSPADAVVLWEGLDSIDTIGTDHCAFSFETKKMANKDDFSKCPNGVPGIEERIPLLYDAVSKNKISLRRFTDLCCTNPAKIFGLYPQKGILAPGSDADIVIIDPNIQKTLSHKNLRSNAGYSAYEGFTVQGYPVCTIARGKVIVEEGKFLGEAGRGKFLRRKKYE